MKIEKENIFDLVYQTVRLIPNGKVTSYGAIASCIGLKSGARMVGYAMSSAGHIPDLPAHRVVNSQGLLTGRHHFGDPGRMQQLLESEGIKVKNNKIINYKDHFWDPVLALNF